MIKSVLDKIPFFVVGFLAVLLPIFVIPGLGFSLDLEKRLLLYLGLAVIAICWIVARIIDRTIAVPKNWLIPAWGLTVLISLAAAMSTGDKFRSLFGFGYERDTFFSIVVLAVIFLVSVLYLNSKEKVIGILIAIVGASGLSVLYQIIQTIFVGFLGFKFLPGGVFNLVGRWNEAGFFWGLSVLIGLSLVELIPWRRPPLLRVLIIVASALSLIALVVVNYWVIWLVILLAVVALLVGRLFSRPENTGRPWLSMIVLVVALIFVLVGRPNGVVSNYLNIFNQRIGANNLEVSPSWSGSWLVAKVAIAEKPLFGLGPNAYSLAWNKSKPLGVNLTAFWNFDFTNAVSFIITLVVTTGLIGFATWLILLILFLYYGLSAPFLFKEDNAGRLLLWSLFVLGAYLWTVLAVYPADIITLFFACVFMGSLVALLGKYNLTQNVTFSFGENRRHFFTGLVVGVIGLVLVIGATYFFVSRFAAAIIYSQALTAVTSNDLNRAETLFRRSSAIATSDTAYRSLVDLGLVSLGQLLNTTDLSQEEAQNRFSVLVPDIINNAKNAVNYSPSNYVNWLYLGRVYETLVPLKIEGTYEAAVNAYNEAEKLNPTNPGIFVDRARLEVAVQNNNKALDLVNQAINLKPNYTEAIFVLAQLETQAGKLGEALRRSKDAVSISPNDPAAFFQLGFLSYQANDWRGAREALKRAVELNPQYANARYFLGLSYDALGDAKSALEQFKAVVQTNPDNAEVKQIISNLNAGRRALENTPPPAPKDRKELPVKDN